ncbi:VOC family protein [Rhodophyticola sp.]|jgi:predicted enzyme related to lactoylglutathione lyase|uniref:VOC family protein n=1 Tax=Rhodophyticola sp. TaxID=2680032 RepID=UPI003D28A9EF
MTTSKTGQIVWHDLFTSNRERTIAFYESVAGWSYQFERATDFAWGGGEKDFVLALSGDEAGAGFAETPPSFENGWIAYVEVADVDAAVALAEKHGGAIVRQPFDVPGVGRNALVRDPLGALVGISLSRHDFPVPHQQFGPEVYLSEEAGFPEAFYAQVFGWRVPQSQKPEHRGIAIVGPLREPLAFHRPEIQYTGSQATWLPSINVSSPEKAWQTAEALGARSLAKNATGPSEKYGLILCDTDGAIFRLSEAQTGSP